MTIPNKPGYSHGSSGTQPSDPVDYESKDAVPANTFDFFIHTEFDYIKSIIDALIALDNDNDEKVDAADFADSAGNVTSTYKGNDIDANGDGIVNRADQVVGADGEYHSVGSLPHFADNTTALNNTNDGDLFYHTGDNNAYINVNGSAQYLSAKTVNILLNGTQHASFEQEETPADYDVIASTVNTTSTYTIASGQHNMAYPENNDSSSFTVNTPGTAPSGASASASTDPDTNVSASISKNGSVVASGSSGEEISWTGNVDPGDNITFSYNINVAASNPDADYNFSCELVDGANITVDNVTQTT